MQKKYQITWKELKFCFISSFFDRHRRKCLENIEKTYFLLFKISAKYSIHIRSLCIFFSTTMYNNSSIPKNVAAPMCAPTILVLLLPLLEIGVLVQKVSANIPYCRPGYDSECLFPGHTFEEAVKGYLFF